MTATPNQLVRRLCLALGLGTLVAFWAITSHDFVTVDDLQYIVENPHVNHGLTWRGVVWAMGSGYACNWHPLTWLSHMVDCNLYGLNPGGHHLTNVLLHAANAMLLFLLLNRVTGATWRSAFVAALFAWHPLRAESVAWAAERKDVLSACFGLLALLAYARYVETTRNDGARSHDPEALNASGDTSVAARPARTRNSATFYFLALLLFGLGLMAKPMLVTFPGVLLLLDYWPLRRAGVSWFRLVREKLPFMALSVGACVVTFIAQHGGGAVVPASVVPIPLRLANVLVSYVRYIGTTFWPVNLSPVYPFPDHWPMALVIGAAGLLAAVSGCALWRAARSPAVFTGWFWFLGTLVPVIGLVQVGPQAMADRYMYIPSMGLFLALVWGLAGAVERFPGRIRSLAGLGAGALAASLVVTELQLSRWTDAVTLYGHAVKVTHDNYIAYDYLGGALHRRGSEDESLAALHECVRLQPTYMEGQYNLGAVLLQIGRPGEALSYLQTAVRLAPLDVYAQHSLGNALLNLGRLPEAEAALLRAAELRPDDANILNALGHVLLRESRLKDAEHTFTEAVRLQPNWPSTHRNLAVALAQQGRAKEATEHFAEAARLDPGDPDLRFNLGLALSEQSRWAEAAAQFKEGLRLRPDDGRTHYRLAAVQARLHQPLEASIHYREALRLAPELPEPRPELAWILATSSDAAARDGAEAVRLAEQVCAAGEPPLAGGLTTLAAAYAEAGRFTDAVSSAQKACEIALATGQKEAAAKAGVVLRQCEAGQPVRD